ncbi:hypothetical protein AQI96_37555 [Streptomyces canus]|nr:hypothetical protein AQI96_37555 [Streptomyces canus]
MRTVAAIDVIRFGLYRDRRRMRQGFRRAMPRSTGALALDSARLTLTQVGADGRFPTPSVDVRHHSMVRGAPRVNARGSSG